MRIINSPLYPIQNKFRFNQLLNSTWNFQTDSDSVGIQEKWFNKLPNPESMPVPGSFSELTTERERKYYTGDFWYEKDLFIPSFLKGRRIAIRFGSVTHRARIFFNGIELGKHEGGFLPFEIDITELVKFDKNNHLAVLVNNELSETTLPCGRVITLSDGSKLAQPYFDFFNYSGIMRNVWLTAIPENHVDQYDLSYDLNGSMATIKYKIHGQGDNAFVELIDNNQVVAKAEGKENQIKVNHVKAWSPENPYLYKIRINLQKNGQIVDQYTDSIGIRTIKIDGEKILLNGKEIHLKGFGKHEDFNILGKATNESLIKRDFECMKWTGANCFRTSHYPYAEEWYRAADHYGFMIIDEVPAVGLVRSTHNFVQAINGKFTRFFQQPTIPKLKEVHKAQIKTMIERDKNHPSVIAWSLFNEPESTSEESYQYFKEIFDYTKKLDPQNRPLTGALENHSQPESDRLSTLCDIVSLNRYFGWYIKGGPQLGDAKKQFIEEMNKWQAKKLNKPFIFTEFGADTLANEHKLPAEMWSQEYQTEIIQMFFDTFKKFDFIKGELVWNFADFKTAEGILRVGGNDKGIFTRDREPKQVAFLFKKMWN